MYLCKGEQAEDPFDFDDFPTPPPRTRRNRRRRDSDSSDSDSDSDSEEEEDALKQAKTRVEELKVDDAALLRAAAGNDFDFLNIRSCITTWVVFHPVPEP